jgi:hypothetical protein
MGADPCITTHSLSDVRWAVMDAALRASTCDPITFRGRGLRALGWEPGWTRRPPTTRS